jgi:hypothetical protein
MSGMSSILGIHPPTQDSSPNELNERGTACRDSSVPSGFPFSFRLVARGTVPVERDPQHAAHAAHAYDPWVLDARGAVVEPPKRALYQDDRDPSLRSG